MKYLRPLLCASLFLAPCFYAPISHAESITEVLERSKTIKPPPAPETFPYSYTANFSLDMSEGKEDSIFQAQYKVNPNAPAGERVSVISASSETYHTIFQDHIDGLEREEMTSQKAASDLWCQSADDEDDGSNDLSGLFDNDPPQIIAEDDTQAVLRMPFSKIADSLDLDINIGGEPDKVDDDVNLEEKGVEDKEDNAKKDKAREKANNSAKKTADKFFKRMEAELVIDKPQGRLRNMRMWLPKPMRIMLIAKVKKMDFSISCEPAPNGHLYRGHYGIEMNISALGKKNKMKQVTEIISLEN